MLTVGLGGPLRIRTVVDLKQTGDITSLIGFLCGQIGVPHIDQLQLYDDLGN